MQIFTHKYAILHHLLSLLSEKHIGHFPVIVLNILGCLIAPFGKEHVLLDSVTVARKLTALKGLCKLLPYLKHH